MSLDDDNALIGDWSSNNNSNQPPGGDPRRQGDNQLRGTKGTVRRHFPNFVGTAASPKTVDTSEDEINTLVGINTGTSLESRLTQIETDISNLEPIGTIKAWPIQEASLTQTLTGANAPGLGTWHWCDGTNLNGSTTYTELYGLIGNDFGGTDAASMLIPKILGRVIAGRGTGNDLEGYREGVDDSAQGNTGGEQSHTPTIGETASHDHGGGDHSHNANYAAGDGTTTFAAGSTFGNRVVGGSNYASIGVSGSRSGYLTNSGAIVTSEGSDEDFNVVQPTIIIAYYIRVL